jgi:hypothetical protein
MPDKPSDRGLPQSGTLARWRSFLLEREKLKPQTSKAAFPITRPAFHVHHGQNPNAFRLLDVNNRVGKNILEMTSNRRIEALRVDANIVNQKLHFIVKATTEFRINF